MRAKKKWIIALTTIAAAALASSSLTVLLWPVDAATAMSTYITKFTGNDESSKAKNEVIQNAINDARDVLNDYYDKNQNAKSLNFYFCNLRRSQTQGERNFYTALDRSMKYIDERLGIQNIQRTPKTINDAFYNKNTEMMSFYWSPDYNNIGTWIKYMLTETYTLPNIWNSVYSILEGTTGETYNWSASLKDFIQGYNLTGTNQSLYMSPIEIVEYVASNKNTKKIKLDQVYTTLANVIGNWIATESPLEIEEELDPETKKMVKKYGGDSGTLSKGIEFVNYVASLNPNIPYQEVGNGTSTPYLISNGVYMPTNSNSNNNFRDWYLYKNTNNKSVVKDWNSADPFTSNETAWNGPFSKASNTLFAQSIWTNLTSWSTRGDENDPIYGEKSIKLLSSSIVEDIDDPVVLEKFRDEFENQHKLTFSIRPIEWVDTNGKGTGSYLSPQDFWAGIYSFALSIQNGLNANNAYFIQLASINFEKTLTEDANNQLRNRSKSETKKFTIYFDEPILSLEDTLDILQKQYFCALPAEHEKVKNIYDPVRYNSIAVNYPGTNTLDTASTNMKMFYGVGDGTNPDVWKELWSSAPYYISNVDKQSITYKINKGYFESFKDLAESNESYISYNLEKRLDDGSIMAKIPEINVKYAGSYNLDILFEQFISKEIDKTPLQGANLLTAINNYGSNLRYESTKKIQQSNVVGFNLQVYEKWTEPLSSVPAGYNQATNIIMDSEGNPMWNPETRKPTYTMDEYGNYVFEEGKKPKLKSNISQEYYDLIVKDFYTPNGTSAKIRFAIMNSINWVSLQTLVTPGVTGSIQYSFMPYGVYNFEDSNGNDITGEYWDLAANKRYMTKEELDDMSAENIKKRKSGNMIWTYGELRSAMIK